MDYFERFTTRFFSKIDFYWYFKFIPSFARTTYLSFLWILTFIWYFKIFFFRRSLGNFNYWSLISATFLKSECNIINKTFYTIKFRIFHSYKKCPTIWAGNIGMLFLAENMVFKVISNFKFNIFISNLTLSILIWELLINKVLVLL